MTSRSVTLRDVAKLAGVHPATASRALKEEARARGLVNPDTVARVMRAAKELDYHPDPVARSLKTRRSHTVGVVIPDLTNPLFPPIVRGIEDRLAQSGYVVLLGNTDNDSEREKLVLTSMRSRRVDALVLATARRRYNLLAELNLSDLPVVLVNRVVDDRAIPSVATDDVTGIGMAVVAGVIGQPEGAAIGKLLGGDEIAPAQLGGGYPCSPCSHVHHPLDQVGGLGSSRPPVGAGRDFVGQITLDLDVGYRYPIGAAQEPAHRDGNHRGGRVEIGAQVRAHPTL